MSIEELLQQMEEYRLRREQRDHRPDWLKDFIRQAAELFEPLTNVGRVGYECHGDEHGWTVCMYLGTTEIIGGPRDGQVDHACFQVDLTRLSRLMESTTRFEWYSVTDPLAEVAHQEIRSLISIHGTIPGGHDVKLELLARPPRHIGPGLQLEGAGGFRE
ncbi:MAG: hypothetical protein R3C19_08415 [Planctomycetaceae bacterium]